jgi:hypothetical protein
MIFFGYVFLIEVDTGVHTKKLLCFYPYSNLADWLQSSSNRSPNGYTGTGGNPCTPTPYIGETITVIFLHDGAPDDISTLVYLAKHPGVDFRGVIQSYGE